MEPEGQTTEEEEQARPRQAPRSSATWGRFVTWGIPALTALVIFGVVLGNLASVDLEVPQPSADPSPPMRGVACPDLQRAAQQLEAGDDSGFKRTVHAAARTGEAALQQSGAVFGRPEKLALELASILEVGALVRDARVDRLMSKISAACQELGRWP